MEGRRRAGAGAARLPPPARGAAGAARRVRPLPQPRPQPRPQQLQPQPRLYSSAPPARPPRGASVRARAAAEDAAARRLPPGVARQTWGVDAAAFEVELGLGRIFALYHRSSTLCQIH